MIYLLIVDDNYKLRLILVGRHTHYFLTDILILFYYIALLTIDAKHSIILQYI